MQMTLNFSLNGQPFKLEKDTTSESLSQQKQKPALIGRKFTECEFCGGLTRPPQWKPDENYWCHFKQCSTCIDFQHKYGFRLTYADRAKLDAEPWCYICATQDNLVIDHCHKTNEVRGYLCNQHNTALGKFHDSITELQMAIEYLTPYETTN